MSSAIERRPTAGTAALLSHVSARPSLLSSNINLTRELAVASFKLKYAGSVLGYIWSLIKPLMIFGMMYLVFALFLLRGRTSQADNFPVQLLVGIVVWSFFADATTSSLYAVATNGDMLRKAYFPRWILVVAATLSSVMTLAVNLLLVLVLGFALHWFATGWQTLLFPVLLLELTALALGLGLLVSAIYVYYRDLGHIWEIALQLLFFASAIVFPFALIPQRFQSIMAMNPIAQMVEDMRRSLVTSTIPWSSEILGWKVVVPVLAAGLSVLLGWLVFRRLSRRFGERV